MANEIDRYRLEPRDGTEAWELARVAAASGLYGVQKPEQALVIIMTGTELGLTANQALRAIQVVKGKPNLSADLIVALVKRSELCESWETIESTIDRCTVETKRRGDANPRRVTWTMEDAKRAGISGDMYQKYPRQMLRHRCSADLAREVYPDLVLGLYASEDFGDSRDLTPEPAEVRPGAANTQPVAEGEVVDVPLALAKVRDSIADVGGEKPNLTAEQAAAIWCDHYAEIVEGGFRERAGSMLELALAPKQKARFQKLLNEQESKIAAAKREALAKAALDELTARLRSTKSFEELAAFVQTLTAEQKPACAMAYWEHRVALCTGIAQLATVLGDVKDLRNHALRDHVREAVAKRQRELDGRGPDDGGPDGGERAPAPASVENVDDPEREAIQAEGRGDLASQALATAVAALKKTNGPRHAINHYLAHRDELPASARAAYREALLSDLPIRYPFAIQSRDVAELEVSAAEAASERKAAA